MPTTNISDNYNQEKIYTETSILLILVCFYIFLLTDRPWESIRYLKEMPLQRIYGALMIITALVIGKFRVVSVPTNKWVYGLLFTHFALAPFAYNQNFAWEQPIEYAKMVVFYLLMVSVAEDERSLKLLIKAFVFSMIIYVIHSIWEYYNGAHVWRMGIPRMIGVGSYLNDPNAFGASIVLSLPFTYALLKIEKTTIVRILYYGYLSLGTICVILTGSRSAFLAFNVLIFLWGLAYKGKKKILALILILISVSTIFYFIPEDKKERIRTIFDKNAGPTEAYESTMGRLAGWEVSWEMFKRKPLTGVGTGVKNFVAYRIDNSLDEDGIYRGEQSHILYGQVLAELGIFGAILFIGLVYSIAKCSIRIRNYKHGKERRQDFSYQLSGAIILSLMLLLFLGFGGHNFYRMHWLYLAAWSSSLFRIAELNKNGS